MSDFTLTSAIEVTASGPSDHAPIILVHGAANSAVVWRFWQRELASHGWSSSAIDLRGHGSSGPEDLSETTMEDYAVDVSDQVSRSDQPPVLIGWSMGGLVSLMVAAEGGSAAWIGLEPSPPALSIDKSIVLRRGVFDSAEYGITQLDPRTQPSMPDLDIGERRIALSSLGPESRLARDQRKRGVVIESVECPLLVVAGTDTLDERRTGFDVPWLQSDQISIPGASHWGLVLSRRVVAKLVDDVVAWLGRQQL